jgi:outer membrane protein assembly complex protein YaeT
VTITDGLIFTKEKIADKLDVKAGDDYDFFKLRRGVDKVSQMYTKADLLESNVRLTRDQKNGTIDLDLRIDVGPRVEFVFEGASVPGDVRDEVRRVWASGVFDTQRVEDSTGVLRAWLIGERHLSSEIRPEVTAPAVDRKRVLFDIHAGPKYTRVAWVFDGAKGISQDRLKDVIEDQRLAIEVYTKPGRVTELVTGFYREMGYLDAAVDAPRYELNADKRTGRVVFAVKEGPLYRVGKARFEGHTALTSEELAAAAPMPGGEQYRPVLRENAIQRLREAYWARGYNDVETEAELERIPERGLVNLVFRIKENARGLVESVAVDGNRNTSENLIRTQLALGPGDPVNLQKIGESRRKLYNTGAFSMVEIARENAGPEAAGSVPVRLRVRVQEVRPFELRYGASYDTDGGPGGIIDFSNRNSLGSARVLGFRGRYDSQLHDARVYFSQPLLSRFPLKTIASPYFRREIHPETELEAPFNVDRIGFSLQQEASLAGRLVLNYGYRIERSHTYDTGLDPIFDVTLRVAALTSTLSRDTRDEILDASRGSFLSHAFQFSPESLGSEVRFVKYFGQYFRYFPLQKPRVELFTNKVTRPRLVYATAVRVGLAHGLGGQVIQPSERFIAGGGTTIRGFPQDGVGPRLGGDAMLVLNNELRFPMFRLFGVDFDGVGFIDIGNVYPKVSDFSLSDVRKSAGFGLRVRTPWVLLRFDYGFKLDRRFGESLGRPFGAIGQAF